ncbi:MAG TPA: AMP-binding protein [Solirubrobacteraceae bacterium]|nr:AMP-binding protein [Solirubrobacteraceae bacterium]
MKTWIEAAAARQPDRIAVEGPERSLSYAELRDAACARAGAIRARRVALDAPAVEEFVVDLHACLLAGAAVVPIDLRLSAPEQALRRASAEIDGPPGGEAPVAVMHTSGTTAAPKPVVLSRANFLASALGSAVALGLDPAERWLCPMPLTHVGGLSIPIRSAIYATTAVLHGRFETEAVLSELMDRNRRVTLVSLVPTMLARLLDAGLARPPTLRWALLGGGPIAPALLEKASAAGVPVAPTYGMTEACSQIATFGWPLSGVDMRVGDDSEVLVRGPIVSAGAVSEDGWLHTGDLGRFDERGRLEIIGRKSDTIVSGGENVAPAEVEAVLLEHPAVADAAVHPRSDPEWGEAVVATVVLLDGLEVAPDELRAHCAARLAGFKVPKAVEFAEGLPRTPSGKLLRRQL